MSLRVTREDLLREVPRILEGLGDGLAHSGRDFDAPLQPVVANLDAEGFEHLALSTRPGLGERTDVVRDDLAQGAVCGPVRSGCARLRVLGQPSVNDEPAKR